MAKNRNHRIQDKTVRSIAGIPVWSAARHCADLVITKATADQWWKQGAGQTADRGRVFILSKPTTDRLQLRCALGGEALIWRYLRGEEEAVALVHAYAPASYQVPA